MASTISLRSFGYRASDNVINRQDALNRAIAAVGSSKVAKRLATVFQLQGAGRIAEAMYNDLEYVYGFDSDEESDYETETESEYEYESEPEPEPKNTLSLRSFGYSASDDARTRKIALDAAIKCAGAQAVYDRLNTVFKFQSLDNPIYYNMEVDLKYVDGKNYTVPKTTAPTKKTTDKDAIMKKIEEMEKQLAELKSMMKDM